MISTSNLGLRYGKRTLFEEVSIKFTPGNCYGLIGANGAGKSTFLRCLAGEQEPSSGQVTVTKNQRVSMLRQDHFAFDEVDALTAVLMGHKRLSRVMAEKDALYAKADFNDEDGARAAELEGDFGELDGWNAEANAASLLSALGIKEDAHRRLVKELDDSQKVRVLLAQALFGEPDVLLLDEPTNHLDVDSILWLEQFLLGFKNTVIVVSHDRHFLDKVCTHIADVDFQKVTLFSGNYGFWYETSQLALRQRQDSNRRKEDKMKELKTFIQRFSANASKSKQATSRRTLLDKITLDDIKPSSRKYPYIVFETTRDLGKDVLFVDGLSKQVDGVTLFKDLRFSIAKGERVAITGSDLATTMLIEVLAGKVLPDSGEVRWGRSVNLGHYPKDNSEFFKTDLNLIDWLRQFSPNQEENFVRAFLGRMLFSGEESKKKASVLSGGEKVRCMLSKMMMLNANVLILDEPTNHLDLESIISLNKALENFSGTVLFTSHDHQFIQTVANRIIEITPRGIIDRQDTTLDEYLAHPEIKAKREAFYRENA